MNQQRLNRDTHQKSISDLIGTKPENTKKYFEPMRESERVLVKTAGADSTAKLQIPEHQRFYVWLESKQISLIDSVMVNNPIPLMVFTEEIVNGRIVTFVQDGQQRLITLQKFMLGHFIWNGKTFDQFDEEERYNFLSYKITCETIKHPTIEQISEIFERLNSGKPLTDNDKFWNRRAAPMVSFALDELINHPDVKQGFKKYAGKVAEGKSRSQLSDIIGAVTSIVKHSCECIRNSFDRIGVFMCEPISEQTKQMVIKIFRVYFTLIETGLQITGNTKPKKIYLKLTGMLGIYLYWRLHPNYYSKIKTNKDELARALECWAWFSGKIQEKTFKQDYFKTLPQGAQRNVDIDALKQRTAFLIENYLGNDNIETNQSNPNQSNPNQVEVDSDTSDSDDDA